MALETPHSQRTIGQLVADASNDLQGIVRSEIQLAKAEVTSGAKVLGIGAGALGAAAGAALFGLIFLLHTVALIIAIWLPVWAGYGIVTLVLFFVAAVAGLIGYKKVKAAKPIPERAIAEGKQTIAAIRP